MHRYALALIILASPFSAFAAELPKEGSYDYTSCWSGVSNTITFSKTHTASSYEMTGTTRSNPDFYALQVMNEILSGGFSGRLMNDIRSARGLPAAPGCRA